MLLGLRVKNKYVRKYSKDFQVDSIHAAVSQNVQGNNHTVYLCEDISISKQL